MSDWPTVFLAGLFVIVIIRAAILDYRQKEELQHWQLTASTLVTHLESMGAQVIIERTSMSSGVTILWPETSDGESIDVSRKNV